VDSFFNISLTPRISTRTRHLDDRHALVALSLAAKVPSGGIPAGASTGAFQTGHHGDIMSKTSVHSVLLRASPDLSGRRALHARAVVSKLSLSSDRITAVASSTSLMDRIAASTKPMAPGSGATVG